MSDRTGKRKKNNSFTKWLIIGVLLSIVIFIFCAVIYLCKSFYISKVVANLAYDPFLTNGEIKAFEALQSYYKDSSNFNIVSLLYVFISSVFIGVLGLFVNNQKEKIDDFEKKIDDFEANKMVKFQDRLREQEANFNESYNNVINEINLRSTLFNTLHDFSFSQILAANIFSQCSYSEVSPCVISYYTTRFRDSMIDVSFKENLEKLAELSLSERDKENIINQIWFIQDLLESAKSENHPGYNAATHREFLGYLNNCLRLLKIDEGELIEIPTE